VRRDLNPVQTELEKCANPRCVRTVFLRSVAVTDVLVICNASFLTEGDEVLYIVWSSDVVVLTVGDHFTDNSLEETVNLWCGHPAT
jgi:hypothetical protein